MCRAGEIQNGHSGVTRVQYALSVLGSQLKITTQFRAKGGWASTVKLPWTVYSIDDYFKLHF